MSNLFSIKGIIYDYKKIFPTTRSKFIQLVKFLLIESIGWIASVENENWLTEKAEVTRSFQEVAYRASFTLILFFCRSKFFFAIWKLKIVSRKIALLLRDSWRLRSEHSGTRSRRNKRDVSVALSLNKLFFNFNLFLLLLCFNFLYYFYSFYNDDIESPS